MPKQEISEILATKHLSQEDRICRYILDPDDPANELNATDRHTMEACERIHTLRHGYHSRPDLIKVIQRTEKGIGNRQAYNLLYKTEKIFGKVDAVNREYIRSFLIDECMHNLREAKRDGPSAHTKAIAVMLKVAGLDQVNPETFDFSTLVQHIYNIGLPDHVLEGIDKALKAGAVNIKDISPPPSIKDFEDIESEEVKE